MATGYAIEPMENVPIEKERKGIYSGFIRFLYFERGLVEILLERQRIKFLDWNEAARCYLKWRKDVKGITSKLDENPDLNKLKDALNKALLYSSRAKFDEKYTSSDGVTSRIYNILDENTWTILKKWHVESKTKLHQKELENQAAQISEDEACSGCEFSESDEDALVPVKNKRKIYPGFIRILCCEQRAILLKRQRIKFVDWDEAARRYYEWRIAVKNTSKLVKYPTLNLLKSALNKALKYGSKARLDETRTSSDGVTSRIYEILDENTWTIVKKRHVESKTKLHQKELENQAAQISESKTYPSKSYYNDVRTLARQFAKANRSCIAAVPCHHTNSTEDRGSRAIVVYLYIHTNGLRITDGFREKAKKVFFGYNVEFVDLEQEQLGGSFFPRDCEDKSNAAEMTKIAQIIEKNFSVFKNRLNVTAVYPSYKISCRQETNDLCIAVAVLGKRKIPVDEEIFPENAMLDGYKFDIVEGYFVPTCLEFSTEQYPLRFGVGIGVRGAHGAGTLGAFVADEEDYFLLSCNHVLYKPDKELTTWEKPGEEKLTHEKLSDEKLGAGMPDEKMPGERKPVEEMPDEGMPVEGMPDVEMPDEGMPSDEKLGTKLIDEKPGEEMPDEEMPDAMPVEGMPDEGMLGDEKPGEEMPDEEMLGDEKPGDESPSEGNSGGEKSPGEKRDKRHIEIESLSKQIADINEQLRGLENPDIRNEEKDNYLATLRQKEEEKTAQLTFLKEEIKLEKRISEIKKELEELEENGDGNQNEGRSLAIRKRSQVRAPNTDEILIEQPSAKDYIQETTYYEKQVVRVCKDLEEKRCNGWDRSIKTAEKELQYYESKLEEMRIDKLPRCIASYVGGFQSNYLDPDLDRMFFVDAGIAKLSDDECQKIKKDKKNPDYYCNMKYSNNVVPCEKMEERADNAKFWKYGRTTKVTEKASFRCQMCIKLPEELKVRAYGDFKHVPFGPFCQTCTKFSPYFSNRPDMTKITKCIKCEKEIPPNEKTDDESWALNCFMVQSRNGFVKPGDSGAVMFDERGNAWAMVVGTYRQGYSEYTITSPLDITLKALNKRLGKNLKLWKPS